MEEVKILLAAFDGPVFTIEKGGAQRAGLPRGYALTAEGERLCGQIRARYDALFDSSGEAERFLGFESDEEKDALEELSRKLDREVRSVLPEAFRVVNTVPETLLLAPLRTAMTARKEARGEEGGFPFEGGRGDCE